MTNEPPPNADLAAAAPLGAEALARRRAASRRLAWLLGAVALAIYLVGLLFKR